MTPLERALALARGGAGRAGGQPAAAERPQRLSGARRRHRHQPGRHGRAAWPTALAAAAAARRRPRRRSRARPRGRADGRPRQQRRDPVPDRARLRRGRWAAAAAGRRGRRWRGRCAAASDAAYGAVRQPVEGTMLTAMREMAEAAERHAAAAARWTSCSTRCWRRRRGVRRTPGDAAGAGRRRGWSTPARPGWSSSSAERWPGMRGRSAGRRSPAAAAAAGGIDAAARATGSAFRYCTTLPGRGRARSTASCWKTLLDPLGDSLLVVGEPPTLKVHVHTDDPGAALSLAVAMGTVERVEIANMHGQTRRRTLRLLRGEAEPPARHRAGGGGRPATARRGRSGRLRRRRDRGRRPVDEPRRRRDRRGHRGGARRGVVVLPNNAQRGPGRRARGRASASRPARGGADPVGRGRAAAGRALRPGAAAATTTPRRLAELERDASLGEVMRGRRATPRMDGIDVREGQHIGAGSRARVVAACADAAAAARRRWSSRLAAGASR